MDDYWMKSGNKEMANKKLDDDMDEYWEQKKSKEGDGEAAVTKDVEVPTEKEVVA